MRRVFLGSALVLAVALAPIAPAGARPASRDRGPGRAAAPLVLADRDGDRVDDVLERRLRHAEPGERQAVVVATDGSVSVAEIRRVVGSFAVARRLGIIDGFSAELSRSQIRALSLIPGVLRIDHDAIVRATLDAARHDYGVDAARSAYGVTGAGVTVCILDTGVKATHEQFDSKSIVWRDFVNATPTTTPNDGFGHGTHVANIAVGDGTGGSNAARFAGVASGADLWAGKVLDDTGYGAESGIIAGINWCAASPDVDVISMSLGSELPSDGTDDLSRAANNAVAAGKVVVAAAGNAGDGPNSIAAPGAGADVIAVGASSSWSAAPGVANHSDGIFLAYFSSRGGSTFAGDQKPDVVAPGYNVAAADYTTTSGYVVLSGTSMATPFAAGSVALALQAHPGWTPAQVQAAIEGTAVDFGPNGKDPDWGAGLIDVLALVANAKGAPAAATTFPTHVRTSGTVPNGGAWNYDFVLGSGDLAVPIAATVLIDGSCLQFFGICLTEWSPDLDVAIYDPNGVRLALSQCMAGTECGSAGHQETAHAMPTSAGTYRIQVYAYPGSPNNGLGGRFDLDLSSGPVGSTPPPPPPPPPTLTLHVGDLDRASSWVTSTTWKGTVTIRVHDQTEALTQGVVVTGRWGQSGSVTCTTNTNGACGLSKNFKKSRASIVFTVLGLSKSGYTYSTAGNHDPDSDSNGTKITVSRP